MNTKEQADQLRLGADILETGHPFEFQDGPDGKWVKADVSTPFDAIAERLEIRPILATPPDGRPLHNPDNLTAEQVGVGHRLPLKDESANQPHDFWDKLDAKWVKTIPGSYTFGAYVGSTYRLPLSVPWPELPIAELPKGLVELDAEQHAAVDAVLKETIYAEPFQLPPPPPGIEWHRTDGWKADDLPQGYRPLRNGEAAHAQDEVKISENWIYDACDTTFPIRGRHAHTRTTRPLEFQHLGKTWTWTWHKAGDPMPCNKDSKIEILCDDNSTGITTGAVTWSGGLAPIGWRYAEPATKVVPLGPSDIPPGSTLKLSTWDVGIYVTPSVWRSSVSFAIAEEVTKRTYEDLMVEGWQINRPANRDADGNPTKWEPCSKQISA